MSLSAGQVSWLLEVSQILVIHYDSHWMHSPSEVMLPFLQCVEDSKEFPIIDVIVSFSRREHLRVISTRVQIVMWAV